MQKVLEVKGKTRCRVCCRQELHAVIDFGDQPLPTNFHSDPNMRQTVYPLQLNVCTICWHRQLSVTIPPRFLYTNYLSVRGVSHRAYFDKLSRYINNIYQDPIDNGSNKILDIGCNDGTALDSFKALEWDTYGVDPAENLYEISSQNHNITKAYWTTTSAIGLSNTLGGITMQVILAINIISYVNDVCDFIRACKIFMSNSTRLYIQFGQVNMILTHHFDIINHENLSYFTLKSFIMLITDNGLKIINMIPQSMFGGSYLFEVVLVESDIPVIAEMNSHLETDSLKYHMTTYDHFALSIDKIRERVGSLIDEYKLNGFKIIGYGASNKANMLLNLINFQLAYIIDDNENKIGLMTPGSNVPIYGSGQLENEEADKILVVILAWNWAHNIKQNLKHIRLSDNIIKMITLQYFPDFETVTILTTH